MKRILKSLAVTLLLTATLCPALSWGGDRSPIVKGGNFGLGLIIGEPGDWGISGKIWLARASALQAALNVDDGTVIQADYCWHHYNIIKPSRGEMPIYIGIGGAIAPEGEGAFAVRGPVGMDYVFDGVPVDLFVEVVPNIWFFDGHSDFDFDAGVGARYFF